MQASYVFLLFPRVFCNWRLKLLTRKSGNFFWDFTGFRVFRARLAYIYPFFAWTVTHLHGFHIFISSTYSYWKLKSSSLFSRLICVQIYVVNTCLSIGKVDVDAIGISTFLFAFSNLFKTKIFSYTFAFTFIIHILRWVACERSLE